AQWLDSDERDLAARLGSAVGWSVLLAPLALAAATPFHLGDDVGWLLLAGGAIALAVGVASPPFEGVRPFRRLALASAATLARLATLVALGIRGITAKDLAAPAWGDSVQHAYVTQLILESGGVPATYGPLVPSQVFDYHFGFQTLAAAAAAVSCATAADAVLAVGQILSGLVCLSTYRFARRLTGRPAARAIAAVPVGLVPTEP